MLHQSLFITTSAAFDAMRAQFEQHTRLAVDTESDSLYSYFEKVCLLQFSIPHADYVVDPLALSQVAELAPLFAAPQIEKIFHAAEYDILCMKRDYQFQFVNIFDTMIAARILGWKNVGLGNILQERFGVALNKKMQRADWGHRPLSAEHLEYARADTHYLLALADAQIHELEKLDRLQEAREEFDRLTRVEPTPRRFDPDGYWNINGARDLDAVGLGILRELYHWRDGEARKHDRPPFKVISDATLCHIAAAHPTSTRALAHLSGVSSFVSDRYGRAILHAVERGRATPQTAQPHPRARGNPPLDNHARTRLEHLKEWRKQIAAKRGVEPDVIVSNDALYAIARKNPRALDVLIQVSGLGVWKANAYGEAMLAVLRGKGKL
jgi:ribonuclease D